ncbi:LLM class F420-dependent oxidoreductase [Actinoalloteichus hymeniacidonis]|uniref:F420-dependent oxidoreductase n=1 Tax=Actinoalloteichus hymeniacidonis TaxID=340345 RepID=A0AAC9HKV0_9PSEU|nr:LLM class F420-dependent oxidoreductase [Actinoalloteichus hymeniacidonis]AOS61257.1 putative F420-dependent oxidoreductase [Actinoalloteichus hymeniacidonis]MBB5910740.1 putative F420-dependent oxidoreductase [Actinoalloteichus hymeniacidonis]
MSVTLGRIGIWRAAAAVTDELAVELDRLGFATLSLGGSPTGDLRQVESILDKTERLTVATSIVNIWQVPAAEAAASYHRIAARHPDRFLLGIGIGHPEATSDYRRPYATIVDYLDELDAEGVPVEGRALAALGPKVLQLAADRTAGALPYLTTPEHTKQAREIVGPDKLLAVEHKVVVETDPQRARAIGRPPVAFPYLKLSNYINNLRRLGFTDEEIADDGNDRLIDALVAWGDADAIAARVTEHFDAGADHVSLQVLTAEGADPLPAFRTLADRLL